MARFFLTLYIIFMPWATWLALSSWLRLPVTLSLALGLTATPTLLFLVVRKPLSFFKDQEDILLVLFLVMVWLAFIMGYFNERSFNHSLSYTFSIGIYFIMVKALIRHLGFSWTRIGKLVVVAVVIANGITILEWTLLNLFSVYIREYFLTGGPGTSNMAFYWQPFFLAVAGVGEEPGNTSSLLNMLFPIGLLYLKTREVQTKYMAAYIGMHVLALVFLASVAGIVFFVMALVAALVLNLNWLIRLSKAFGIFLLIFAMMFAFDLFHVRQHSFKYWEYMEEKVSLSSNNPSSLERTNKWQLALTDWWDSPIFGHGPGYGTEEHTTGYFNTFLSILADTGIFSFLLFTLFLFIIFLKTLRLPPDERFFYFFSFSVLLLHSSVYYVYYHSAFWLPIILIQLAYARERETEETEQPEGPVITSSI